MNYTETDIRNNIVHLEILIEHSPSEGTRICAAWCREDWVKELRKLSMVKGKSRD